VVEAQRVPGLLERLELVGMPVAHDGQVTLGRAQVLADRDDLDLALAQPAEGVDHLVERLPEADHEPDFVATSSPAMCLAFSSTRDERSKVEPRRATEYSRGTTSTLWLKTWGRSARTVASGISCRGSPA
jgi:hypothetical protein